MSGDDLIRRGALMRHVDAHDCRDVVSTDLRAIVRALPAAPPSPVDVAARALAWSTDAYATYDDISAEIWSEFTRSPGWDERSKEARELARLAFEWRESALTAYRLARGEG